MTQEEKTDTNRKSFMERDGSTIAIIKVSSENTPIAKTIYKNSSVPVNTYCFLLAFVKLL
jgi:hypothetical protein